MNKWITADLHLGENRWDIMYRPFNDAQEMVDQLVTLHNKLVQCDDEVIVVGDVCYRGAPEFVEQVSRFNGRKTLIRGNHDRGISDEIFSKYFDKIVPDGDGIEMDVHGIPCYITHYPTRGRKDRFNLVGHVHFAWKFQLNMVNVGIDCSHFRPTNMAAIPTYFKLISQYYDQDIWAAYSGINTSYLGQRGKTDSYFTKEKHA